MPLEKLIELQPDYLVMASLIEQPDGQGALYLTHPALRALYPPARRIVLPSRFTLCAGPSLIAAFDYLTEVVTRLAAADRCAPTPRRCPRARRGRRSAPPGRAAGSCVDLISRRKPSRTAGMASKPGRAATFAGTNFLPHHEPTMMSGCAAITASGSDDAVLGALLGRTDA